jgi:hypothetical protein
MQGGTGERGWDQGGSWVAHWEGRVPCRRLPVMASVDMDPMVFHSGGRVPAPPHVSACVSASEA